MSTHIMPRGRHSHPFSPIEWLLLLTLFIFLVATAGLFIWSLRNRLLAPPVPLPTAVAIAPTLTMEATDGLTPTTIFPPTTPTLTPASPLPATATWTAIPPTVTPIPPSATPACVYAMRFVADVTIPDDTVIPPGVTFVKTWRIRNVSACPWPAGTSWVFAGGRQMNGPTAVAVPATNPGETADLSVTLTAPTVPGVYTGYWTLRLPDGLTLSSQYFVRIVVPAPTATPAPIRPTATPTTTPAVSPAPVTGNWRGDYFSNASLTGTPFLARDDAAIDFNWGTGSPASGLPSDAFSVRWTRAVNLPAGTYRFYARGDDGLRVWLNNGLIIDEWHEARNATYMVERTLNSGSHTLRVEYYENWGEAHILFWWERLGEFPQWQGEYFNNLTLSGAPIATRNDSNVAFDWGLGAPTAGVAADNFSVRWTRSLFFSEGLYRFRAVVDDGIRIYVDHRLVVDDWRDGSRREVSGAIPLTLGYHRVRVLYYERAGEAVAQVWWDNVTVYPDWKGEYWANPNLAGEPTLVRNDAAVDFNWGGGAPAGVLPADNFSARWTRSVPLETAVYRFRILVDDGARLWLDNQLILNDWRDGGTRELVIDYPVTAGNRSLRLEYYERGGESRIRLTWEKLIPTATPSPTATAVPPTNTPTATPTLPPTFTPTATPTATAAPMDTPAPTVAPSP